MKEGSKVLRSSGVAMAFITYAWGMRAKRDMVCRRYRMTSSSELRSGTLETGIER